MTEMRRSIHRWAAQVNTNSTGLTLLELSNFPCGGVKEMQHGISLEAHVDAKPNLVAVPLHDDD